MSLKECRLMAIAVLLLATAVAAFGVFGDDSVDAAKESPFAHADDALRPHGPLGSSPDVEAVMAVGTEFPGMLHHGHPMTYVIEAPDRPDRSMERLIEDYGAMYGEKHLLEMYGAEVFIHDPEFEGDAGNELAKAINDVFDGAIMPEAPKDAVHIVPDKASADQIVTFINVLMDHTDENSWLRQLLYMMIAQYASSQSESEGVAPSSGRDDDIPAVSPELSREEGSEKDPESYVDDIPEYTPSSKSYLRQHGFDGGTVF